jgi:hypothetical protein
VAVAKRLTNHRSQDSATSVNYDETVGFAGNSATSAHRANLVCRDDAGQHRFPWGDQFPTIAQPRIGSVSAPGFDRLDANPPVYGLCSNKAEWIAWVASYVTDELMSQSTGNSDYRTVRGGDLATVNGDPALSAESRDPHQRWLVLRHQEAAGLGFRCVRSAAPVVKP